MLSLTAMGENITFSDNQVKTLCLSQWDDDNDGEISMEEAASVTTLGALFGGTDITSFDELQYFTGLTKITSQEFSGCQYLTSIILPAQVKSIGGSAFQGCTALTAIDIPAAVTSIDSYAFNGCIYLADLTLNEGLTTIGDYAFYSCKSLGSLSIPASVTSISASAFRTCPSLTTITVDASNDKYDSREDCNAIIESSTNTLLLGTASTVIPTTVTAIGTNAFYGNYSLTSIVIPEGVKTIGSSAFSGCTALTNVTTPSTLTTIGSGAFSGCTKLAQVILSEGLTTIESDAFKQCKVLKRIRIPSTVSSIAYGVFNQCTSLEKVAVDFTTPVKISSSTTFSNRSKATLYVPKGCVSAFQGANIWSGFKTTVEQLRDISATTSPAELGPGDGATIEVSLDNDDFYSYGSLEMDITFAEGFTPNPNSIVLTSRCQGMQATMQLVENNTYHLTCSSANASITGSEGALFSFSMTSSADVTAGDYQATMTNIILTGDDGSKMSGIDATTTWTVNSFLLGDANHDGWINIFDVTAVINYILGKRPERFFFKEADVSGDNVLNIFDVTKIINIILGKN